MKILSFIINLIPARYITISKILAVIVFAFACMLAGNRLTVHYYKPSMQLIETKLQTCESNYKMLSGISSKQNIAILQLNAAKDTKEKQVKLAQDKAKQLSQINNKQVQDILRLQLGNKDACQAASALVDEELAKERNNAKNW